MSPAPCRVLVGLLLLGGCAQPIEPIGPCTPTPCEAAQVQCGRIGDGCGGVLDCGGCATGQGCGVNAAPNQCGPLCLPRTCADLGATCGQQGDGCGGSLECGTCSAPGFCGGGGPNTCGTMPCTPSTCAALGATCGVVGDGCGAVLSCGVCAAGEQCGAAQPNRCDAVGMPDAGPGPCAGVSCGANGQCAVLPGGAPVCVCSPGYTLNGSACVLASNSLCSGITCSGQGTCAVQNGIAVCQCNPGFTPLGLSCRPNATDAGTSTGCPFSIGTVLQSDGGLSSPVGMQLDWVTGDLLYADTRGGASVLITTPFTPGAPRSDLFVGFELLPGVQPAVSVGFIGWDRYLFSRQLAAPLLVPVPLPAETNISGFDFGADGYYWLSTKTQGPGRLVGLNTLYRTTLSPVATAAFNTDDVRRSQLKVTPSSFYFFETTFSDPNQMQPTRWALKRRDRTTGVEATLGPETVTATPARFTDTHVAWRTSSDLWVQALASGNRRTLSRGTGGTFQAVGLGRDAAYLARGNTVFRGPITVERLSLSTGAVTPFWSYQDPNGRSLFTDVAVLGRCVVAGINGDAGGALGGGRIVVIGEDP